MEPGNYYTSRVEDLQEQLQGRRKKKTILAWLRFAAVLGIGLSVYFLWPSGWAYVTVPVILLLIAFTRLLLADLRNNEAIAHTQELIQLNKDELKALQQQYHHFDDGHVFMPAIHHYANDLDIFGRASLYQYINRTRSEMGNAMLAAWLLEPATPEKIAARQEAVKELLQHTDWRQELQATGTSKRIKRITQDRLRDWLNESPTFVDKSYWQWVRWIVPVAVLGGIALNVFDITGNILRNYLLLGSGLLALFLSKKISHLHAQVSKMSEELEVLSDSIRLIEHNSFKSPLLQQIQQQFLQQNGSASTTLNQLRQLLERLDMRYNIVVSIPLNILLQWDLQQALELEKWKKRNQQNISHWFEALAELEALHSFATLAFNHPGWCWPAFKAEHFFIEGKGIGHPLIPENKRVVNDIKMDRKGELMLVTGSNMAGKSTYLRSIGINVVLAMAGAPVCATEFRLSHVQLISSMRIADNLEESTSTFYAELKKLKTVIDHVNNGDRVFILLDEILRGTNSLDRHTGSVALLQQLIRHDAAAIIATHDVELAQLKATYPANILNYHFDVQVSNDELYFDYKLKEGVCTSLNASILMKKIGIEL